MNRAFSIHYNNMYLKTDWCNMSSLSNALPTASFNVYYDRDFMSMIEYHLPHLRTLSSTESHPVDPVKRHMYEGDFYGYLTVHSIPQYLHWITLRLNHMHNPIDFVDQDNILIPASSDIEEFARTYRTEKKI